MALGGKRRPGDAIADVAVVPRRLAHLMPARGAAGAADEAEAEHEEEHGQEGGQGPEAAVTEPTGTWGCGVGGLEQPRVLVARERS